MMADLGDYITRLICDASKYAPGANMAITANKELSGSCNTIIGALNRQQKAIETAGRTTLDWINADQKASFEVKEHTRNLLEHVNALRAAHAVRESMKNGTYRSPTQLMNEAGTSSHASRQADYDRMFAELDAAQKREQQAWRAHWAEVSRIQSQGAHKTSVQLQSEADAARHASRQADYDQMAAGLSPAHDDDMMRVRRKRVRGGGGLDIMSDEDVANDEAARRRLAGQAGDAWREEDAARVENENRIRANNNRIRRLRNEEEDDARASVANTRRTSRELAQHRRDDANVQRQIEAQRPSSASQHQNQSPRDNRQWAGVEGFRALEDFIQGSAYGGLRGGLLAASNNISQMGAAFGAAGAMAGSAASALIVLGSNAYEAWRNADGAIDLARKRVDEYSSSISKAVSLHGELRAIQLKGNARQDSQSSAEGNLRAIKEQRDALTAEIKSRDEETRARDMAMGIEGLTPEQVATASRQRAAQDRQLAINDMLKWTPFKWVGGKETLPQSDAEQAAVNQLRLAAPNADDKGMNAERHAADKQRQENKRRETELTIALNLAEKEFNRTRRESMEAVQRQIRLDAERFQLLKNGRKDRMETMTAAEQEQFLQNRQQAKKEADINRRETARKWVGNRTEDLLLSGMKTDKERDAYAAEKEYQESLRRSFAAQQEKLLTPEEREAMDKKSQEKRDRDIRNAKYGDLQAGGSSGFASADIKSAAGMNNVMQAIRYANQTDVISELKKNGDISKEIATATQGVKTILESKPPVPVFDSI